MASMSESLVSAEARWARRAGGRRECVIKTALLLARAGLLSLHTASLALASCCAQLESGPGPGNTSAE